MKAILSVLAAVARAGTGLAFAVLAGAVLVQVYTRTVLPQSPVWTEELSRFALLFVVAFGVGLSVRSGDLVNVDLVLNLLPKGGRRWLEALAFAVTSILGGVVAWASLEFVDIGQLQTSPALDWRMDFIFVSIPIAGVMLAVFALERAIRTALGRGRDNQALPES